jgi:hypothetical protein
MLPQIFNPQLYFKGNAQIEVSINIQSDSSVDKLLLEYGFFDPTTSTTIILGSDWVLSHCSAVTFPCPSKYWCRYDIKPVINIKDIKYSESKPPTKPINWDLIFVNHSTYWTINDPDISIYDNPLGTKQQSHLLFHLPSGSTIQFIKSYGLFWKQIIIISSSDQSIRPGRTGWIDSKTIQSISPDYSPKP